MTIGNDYQRGLTLLELLVAITLGLAVVTGTIQIYLGTSQTYRVQEAQSRIQENGRFAMEILNREIRMAGFGGSSIPLQAITKGTADAIETSYIMDPNPEQIFEFYIHDSVSGSSTSLYQSTQELIEHVQDMRILYGVDNDNNGRVDNYVLATDVTNWSRVITVRLNLLLASPPDTRVINEAQTVFFPPEGFDSSGNLVSGIPLTFDDGRLRQVFSTTIGIRNRLL
jgi:type IV pilus assembly protein PilW